MTSVCFSYWLGLKTWTISCLQKVKLPKLLPPSANRIGYSLICNEEIKTIPCLVLWPYQPFIEYHTIQ